MVILSCQYRIYRTASTYIVWSPKAVHTSFRAYAAGFTVIAVIALSSWCSWIIVNIFEGKRVRQR